MATQENAICLLFLHELREQAKELGTGLSKRGVKCLTEKPCLEAFVNEWTIARLAWIERLSESMTSDPLRQAVKRMILEAVNTYDGPGETTFVDYQLSLLSPEEEDQSHPKTAGSLFLSGFGARMERVPPKSFFAKRLKLTPHEQVELMMVVNQSCWTPGLDLTSTLEAFRSRAVAEIISVA